jgi:hypothetical protein
MIEDEFGSTGADETSTFQAFVAGNGTEPLKLPPMPTVIPLQAEAAVPVTVTVTVAVTDPALFVAVSV